MGKIILKIIKDKSVGAAFFHAEIYNCMKLPKEGKEECILIYTYIYAYLYPHLLGFSLEKIYKFTFPLFYRLEIWESSKVLKGLTIPGVTDFQPMSSTG